MRSLNDYKDLDAIMIEDDEMDEPCVCPKCGGIHELQASKKCLTCGSLQCPNCMDPTGYRICIDCAADAENDTL